jgi:hypothetical protein
MQAFLILVAIALGHFFAYIDSRPNFDDTGILAVGIAIKSAILAAIDPRRPWLWALAVGIWVRLYNWIHNGNLASLLALVFAFAGAYIGAALAKLRVQVNG